MAHFNFVISQNAKWGHAGFYIDCHRMTVPENILLQKSTVGRRTVSCYLSSGLGRELEKLRVGTPRLELCGPTHKSVTADRSRPEERRGPSEHDKRPSRQ